MKGNDCLSSRLWSATETPVITLQVYKRWSTHATGAANRGTVTGWGRRLAFLLALRSVLSFVINVHHTENGDRLVRYSYYVCSLEVSSLILAVLPYV